MRCQNCKKQTATVHLTDLLKGEKHERHLCEECAVKEKITAKTHPPSINDVLNSFLMSQSVVKELGKLKCPDCGMSFVEFRSQGLLGCPNDYDVFDQALSSVIERAQDGETQHIGKSPGESADIDPIQRERLKLQRELREAVKAENYELAAELRDRLEEMHSE
ncbi:MAG: UvrB/UvrC motif-containing protein [Planctomycetota bacterium]|nr:MAG: UvrB/UvrC motif-containing protein [Planctomycetota bacterium]